MMLSAFVSTISIPSIVRTSNKSCRRKFMALLVNMAQAFVYVSRVCDVITGATNRRGAYTRCCAMERAITFQQ